MPAYEQQATAVIQNLTASVPIPVGGNNWVSEKMHELLSVSLGTGSSQTQTVNSLADVTTGTKVVQMDLGGAISLPTLPSTVTAVVFTKEVDITVATGHSISPGKVFMLGSGNDKINLSFALAASVTSQGAIIDPGAGNNTVVGTSGADVVYVGPGAHDTVNGGAGLDVVHVSGKMANATITTNGTTQAVTMTDGTSLSATNVEIVEFDDGVVVNTANANEAAIVRLYQVLFGRTPDVKGVEYWMGLLRDGSVKVMDVATGFLASSEAQSHGLSAADAATFLQHLYQTAFNRTPDAAGLAYWQNALQHGTSQAQVAAGFATSDEASVKVVGVHIITDSL